MIWIITALIALVLLVVIAFFSNKQFRKEFKKTGKYPEGHFIGQGLGIGIAIGVGIGTAIGNIGLGPAIGLPIGYAIGFANEKKYKEKGLIRPLTKEEKARKKFGAYIALGIGIVVFLFLIGLFFFN